MNAKQLKAAFILKTPVCCENKEYAIKLGYVKEIIYSLSHSGKVKAMGVVKSYNNMPETKPVLCRHIHLIDNTKKQKKIASTPNKHSEQIKNAFLNTLPVSAMVPNIGEITGRIKEIIYWRNAKGSVQCSVNILDECCPHCLVKVRIKYIHI